MATPTIGINRALDGLGRIVIPKEYRDQLGIHDSDNVEIVRVGNALRLRKLPRRLGEKCSTCQGTGLA